MDHPWVQEEDSEADLTVVVGSVVEEASEVAEVASIADLIVVEVVEEDSEEDMEVIVKVVEVGMVEAGVESAINQTALLLKAHHLGHVVAVSAADVVVDTVEAEDAMATRMALDPAATKTVLAMVVSKAEAVVIANHLVGQTLDEEVEVGAVPTERETATKAGREHMTAPEVTTSRGSRGDTKVFHSWTVCCMVYPHLSIQALSYSFFYEKGKEQRIISSLNSKPMDRLRRWHAANLDMVVRQVSYIFSTTSAFIINHQRYHRQ